MHAHSGVELTGPELPFYVEFFHPRWPLSAHSHSRRPLNSCDAEDLVLRGDLRVDWSKNDPVPFAANAAHASAIYKALSDFHVAVALAREDRELGSRNTWPAVGEHQQDRYEQRLREIVFHAMPNFRRLDVRKDQVVFFYHGRGATRLGELLWEAMLEEEIEMEVKCSNGVRQQEQSNVVAEGQMLGRTERQREVGTSMKE